MPSKSMTSNTALTSALGPGQLKKAVIDALGTSFNYIPDANELAVYAILVFPKTSQRASIVSCCGLFLPIFFKYKLFNGLAIVYSHHTIKDTRLLVYSARVLLPMDMVLFGKWYSVRVCLFPR